MCQYISNVKYLNGFLLKRFRSVYIPYLIATLMYTFFVRNQNVSYTLLIKNIFLMDRVLPFAWYVPVILVWYLLFFEVLKLINDPKRACVIFLYVQRAEKKQQDMTEHEKCLTNGTYERARESGTEQNYDMIDGCVNNVPKKPRRIGGRWSVLDRLHIKQAQRKQKDQTQQQQQERSRKN